MTMTDPIADMLTRIRNANIAMHDEVRMPSSKLKEALAAHPRARGLHRGLRRVDDDAEPPGQHAHDQHEVLARPRAHDLRARAGCPSPASGSTPRPTSVPRVLGGLGVAVLSTSQGLMTDREARQRRVGGEVLCYVW